MRHTTCQWIAGNPTASDSCKCGEPVSGDQPYCTHHFDLAYQKPEPRRRSGR